MRNNTLDLRSTLGQKNEIQIALLAFFPVSVAIFIDHPIAWFASAAVYLALGVLQAERWSMLLASWWIGWALVATGQASLTLYPTVLNASSLTLLVGLTVFALLLFALLAASRRDRFDIALMLLPTSLESIRFLLLRDATNGMQANAQMLVTTAVFYPALILLLYHWRSERKRWWVLSGGTLAYLIAVLTIAWPSPIGFLAFYSYLPLLAVLLFLPVAGPFSLYLYQLPAWRLDRTAALNAALLPLVCLVAGASLLATYQAPPPSAPDVVNMPSATKQQILIDTDMSFDDYVAILYLLQSPEVEIVGITSVHGVANVGPGTENIQRVLALAEREDIPVAQGATRPLAGARAFPAEWGQMLDVAFRPYLPMASQNLATMNAAELMQQIANQSSHPIDIVALGPLTNVAQALKNEPAFANQISSIIIGGGAIDMPDVFGPDERDWNLWLDPQANEIVLTSGAKLVVTPLDVTHEQVRFARPFVDKLLAASQGRDTQLLASIASLLLMSEGDEPQAIWDAVTAVIITHPEMCTSWKALPLEVSAGENSGFLQVGAGATPNASVCMAADQAAFENGLLSTLR